METLSPPSTDHAFPLLAIAVLSIISTALLLFFYYFLVNKCCPSNRPQWLSLWRERTRSEDSFIALSPTMWMNRGLDESIIREIPMFQYTKEADKERRSIFNECIVCLNEFQDMDMVRVLPNCSHSFHLDCIDIWLQSNANCPLCRKSISGSSKYPFDNIIAPSSSPQGSQSDTLMGGDDDFVVIELGNAEVNQDVALLSQGQKCQSPAAKVVEERKPKRVKPRKRQHVSIMGDECIDTREKDDRFSIQPIRRSFSLDSAVDQQLYLSVQAIIQQNTNQTTEESSNSNRPVQRSNLFKCRGTRKASSFCV